MKKIILLISLICIFIFPSKVKADSLDLVPTNIYYSTNITNEVTPQRLYFYNTLFYGYSPPIGTGTINRHIWRYNYNFNKNDLYDISFLFFYNVRYGTPIITVNSKVCNIVYELGDSTQNGIGKLYGVVCEDISFDSNIFDIVVLSSFDLELANRQIGISSKFNISSVSSSDVMNEIQNDIQDVNDSVNNVGDKVGDVNDTLNDGSTDDPGNSFNDYNDKLAKNGVITNLITLPISMFTNILNSINGTCTTFSLGELMGTNLTFPCINISNYLGSSIWGVIDILFSGFFVLVISKKMIKVFENFSSMREGDVLGD